MPRYFFNITDGRVTLDDVGTVLSDTYAAQDEAVRASGGMIREMGGKFWDEKEWMMEVSDEGGQALFALRFLAEERSTADNAFYAVRE
jgi:hypothetical protein